MREIGIEEHKVLLLGIMDAIHEYCEERKLRYTLFYGSMIGAVRHQGFIPWDDDLDIAMPRLDYETFRRDFNDFSGGRYRLIDADVLPGYYLPFAKVIDTHTELLEEVDSDIHIGVSIDVFPIDVCPGDLAEAKAFARHGHFPRTLITAKNIYGKKRRALHKRVVIALAKTFSSFWSREMLIRKLNEENSKYASSDESNFVGEIDLMTYGADRSVWPRELFSGSLMLSFERREYRVASGFDQILRVTYGDYMELPPEEKRVTHHRFVAWMLE